jgi:hypothetical protein
VRLQHQSKRQLRLEKARACAPVDTSSPSDGPLLRPEALLGASVSILLNRTEHTPSPDPVPFMRHATPYVVQHHRPSTARDTARAP